jgi:hypothetical protein
MKATALDRKRSRRAQARLAALASLPEPRPRAAGLERRVGGAVVVAECFAAQDEGPSPEPSALRWGREELATGCEFSRARRTITPNGWEWRYTEKPDMMIATRPPQLNSAGLLSVWRAPTLHRGRRSHHVQRERIGTWETSFGPRTPWRPRTAIGTLWARCRGTDRRAWREGGAVGGRADCDACSGLICGKLASPAKACGT